MTSHATRTPVSQRCDRFHALFPVSEWWLMARSAHLLFHSEWEESLLFGRLMSGRLLLRDLIGRQHRRLEIVFVLI